MIKTYENQEVHSSLIDALVAQEVKRQNAEMERRYAGEIKAAKEPGVMMRPAYEAYWAEKIADARYDYGRDPCPPKWAAKLWGAYGLVVLVIGGAWHKLMAALGL